MKLNDIINVCYYLMVDERSEPTIILVLKRVIKSVDLKLINYGFAIIY